MGCHELHSPLCPTMIVLTFRFRTFCFTSGKVCRNTWPACWVWTWWPILLASVILFFTRYVYILIYSRWNTKFKAAFLRLVYILCMHVWFKFSNKNVFLHHVYLVSWWFSYLCRLSLMCWSLLPSRIYLTGNDATPIEYHNGKLLVVFKLRWT